MKFGSTYSDQTRYLARFDTVAHENTLVSLTVRFSPTLHDLVREEAHHEGVTAAQFIREASLLRAAFNRANRTGTILRPEVIDQLERLIERSQRTTRSPSTDT
jgi:hypothetical protein